MEPAAVNYSTGVETSNSLVNCERYFDNFELNRLFLSCVLIKSLLIVRFSEKLILVCFFNATDYDDLPGQVLLMMTLEACNTSANIDVKGIKNSCKTLSLSTYPGENIEASTIEAL